MFLAEARIASAVTCNIQLVYALTTFCLFAFSFFLWGTPQLQSDCPVTKDLIVRVDVKATRTTKKLVAAVTCFPAFNLRHRREQSNHIPEGTRNCFFNTSTFQLLNKPRGHRCRLFPPVLAFNFYRAKGSAIPLLVDFSSSVANSRSRVFRKSICVQK